MKRKDWEKRLREAVDTEYAYRLAKRMELPRTNPVLGYRTAGSKAERETGELLAREMEALGLEVSRDRIFLDGWDFHHAVMQFTDAEGVCHVFQLGAYQASFQTEGAQEFSLVDLGKGTAQSYEHVDVTGKLVLVDINQRDEWWINFPVYQAWLKGAAALIAVQEQGYGEIHAEALNAQDIAGPDYAAAFSISQADAAVLRRAMGEKGEVKVLFDASSRVERDRETFNIVGKLPGELPEEMILLSAHYDSYFSGFQDDNAAVAMMLGIARAFRKTGYRPRRTLVFCAMAAEEWGVVDSKYDWSTGAYEQVFTVHPEWQGRVVADLNFELPAHAHGKKDAVRCTYEYVSFLQRFLEGVRVDPKAYPEGIEIRWPIQTWSDDFSMAIAGIPSLVNEFSGGAFMETHYHSQFDNEEFYDEAIYRFHHQLYSCLVLAFDRMAAVPMDFSRLFAAARDSLDRELCRRTGAEGGRLEQLLEQAAAVGGELYQAVEALNARNEALLEAGKAEEALALTAACRPLNRALLSVFRKEQDYFVRLDWQDAVLFPQEAVQRNLAAIDKAQEALEEGNIPGALEAVYEIDNNCYAFQFEEEVFRHFTEYVLNQPKSRLKWGAGRIVHHENLFGLVSRLKEAEKGQQTGEKAAKLTKEREYLRKTAEDQEACFRDDIQYMISSVEKLREAMQGCLRLAGDIRG